ncbi:IclR family transcriptional regulator [Fusobacterium sp. PH5-44]|uniref:IclR family transcriptional regulator n=1 Tax=unclassified Fusobacterium TaxID=2648384 RepID=UPI003D1DE01A
MIQSLLKAIKLLEALNGKEGSYSIGKLATMLDLPPSTIHRLIKTLCAAKFVIQDEKSHDYKLGPALIPLGVAASKNLHLQNAAHSVLKDLSAKTKEDTFLVIPVGHKGIVLERFDGPSSLKIVEEFGYELYLHSGAVRKALLAFQSKEFIDEYIESVIKSETLSKKINPEELMVLLDSIRKNGYATSRGDYADGTVGVGAPIFNADGKVIASIGIVAPEGRINTKEKLNDLRDIVIISAKNLSHSMGYFK